MFLHVGNSKTIRAREIIGIFDADRATVSPITKQYLARAEKERRVRAAADEVPRSFVVYRTADGFAVCFSPLSPAALCGRSPLGRGARPERSGARAYRKEGRTYHGEHE